MPFFSPKTWKQRIVEFPGRRRLDDTSSADVYDVSRAEGTVTQEGDGFTAANMNDLEQRINNAVNDVAGLSADEYDPNATYSSGDLRIHDNILHKANQDISVAEPWTPAHWDATTIAAELKAQAEDISDLNSRKASAANLTYTTIPISGSLNEFFANTQGDRTISFVYCEQNVTGFPDGSAEGIVLSQKTNSLWGTQIAIYNGKARIRGYIGSTTPTDWTNL